MMGMAGQSPQIHHPVFREALCPGHTHHQNATRYKVGYSFHVIRLHLE
jgi:hypothetical protein